MKSKTLNILLVEDQPGDSMIIGQAIRESGYSVNITVAESISKGISYCQSHDFDCIFLDYLFPESNGREFIKQYILSNGHASIIVVTDQEDVNIAVECMKNGATDYISKSQLDANTFAKSITNALRIRAAKKAAEEAEQSLLESEMRLRNIISRSPIIFFTIDNTGVFSLFRGKAANSLSIRPEEVTGKNIKDLSHLLPIRYSDFQRASKGEQFQSTTEVNGHHFEINYIPVKTSSAKVSSIMGVVIDITNFKRNEEQLISNLELAEATSKIKEQFLANMSHEIRTPIHGIISLVQFVLNTSLHQDQINYLNLIRKSADTLLVIVNDILDLSKLEADKMTFEEIDFNLSDTIQSAVAAFLPKTMEKGIELKTQFPDRYPEYINGDPVRLIQIINNLMGNAVKFTEKGFVSLTISIAEENEDYMVFQFEFCDSGIGIPPHKIDSIFDNFSQAGADVSRKYGGTGLGLSITKRLIEKQNGMIHVDSLPDEGSTFTVRLPYKHTKGAKQHTTISEKTVTGLPQGVKILVAEDNDINRFILQKMLRDWNVTPDFAVTGTEAVSFASKNDYDIILMDIEMPGMNGYRATEMIRNEFEGKKRHVPIVAMTGHAMQGERQKCMDCGMNDYLSKPFQPEDLRKMITRLVNATRNGNTLSTASEKEVIPNYTPVVESNLTNLSFLREISDGNDQFFKEFLEMFIANTPPALQDLQVSYRSKNWEKLRQTAHKMKPSFNYIGMKELNHLSGKVEELARNQAESKEIENMINQILQDTTIALAELKKELTLLPQTK